MTIFRFVSSPDHWPENVAQETAVRLDEDLDLVQRHADFIKRLDHRSIMQIGLARSLLLPLCLAPPLERRARLPRNYAIFQSFFPRTDRFVFHRSCSMFASSSSSAAS